MSSSDPLPLISQSDCNPVPVFNCHVILRQLDGKVYAKTANLAGIEAEGTSERDVLMAITRQFKDAVKSHHDSAGDIPWIEPPAKANAEEYERFIPVHL